MINNFNDLIMDIDNTNNNNYLNKLYIKDLTGLFNSSQSTQIQSQVNPRLPRNIGIRKWSPISGAGVVYEFDRGVIGIDPTGNIKKEILDGTDKHHSDATIRITNKFGHNLKETEYPFQAGMNSMAVGILIIQLEGNNAQVYFPEVITAIQQQQLIEILDKRGKFNFNYICGQRLAENVSADDVISFSETIKSKTK